MKIIFAGTPEFAAQSLAAIIEAGHQVIAVYSQPDRPAGRGKKLLKSAVKQVAEAHNIPVYQPEKLTTKEAQQELSALAPDLMIVAAYGLLLPKAVLDTPRYGCVNIHGSLLPRWRGAAPIQRAIQAGDSKTGITIMQMDEGLDTGDMILKLETEITDIDTGGSLHDKLADLGSEAILCYLDELAQGALPEAETQNNQEANYAHKLSKQEALIDWQKPATQIALDIRAFNPWPVCYFEYTPEGKETLRVRVFEANELTATDLSAKNTDQPPGTILRKDKNGLVINCAEGAITIKQLQFPGAKAMDIQAFVNGGKPLLNEGEIVAGQQ